MENDFFNENMDTNEAFDKTRAEQRAEQLVNNPSAIEQAAKRFFQRAKAFVDDPNKLERMLQRLEKKLQSIPNIKLPRYGEVDIGEKLSYIPTFASMIRSYLRKEYTGLSRESLVIIIGSLLYFLSPIDLIPDWIPLFGLVDDALMIKFVLSRITDDVEAYREWRYLNGKEIVE